MDSFRLTLVSIDEELGASEVESLCFLCFDLLSKKRLETVQDGRDLFNLLEEKGLLEDSQFLSQLLTTIGRIDLVNSLDGDSNPPRASSNTQTDARPLLSEYRIMLFHIHENVASENLKKIKFLLGDKIGRRQLEDCRTALSVFAEMEKNGLLSSTNLEELEAILQKCDVTLVKKVEDFKTGRDLSEYPNNRRPIRRQDASPHSYSMEDPRGGAVSQQEPCLSISETTVLDNEASQRIYSDAERSIETPRQDQNDYYTLTHNPRGKCVIISNEKFQGELLDRPGTDADEKALKKVFSRLGFEVTLHKNKTAEEIKTILRNLGMEDFQEADALVVCVLSHGEQGCVFGTDESKVLIRDLTRPFTSESARTLAGKPKLFFIQACQGAAYQRGVAIMHTRATEERVAQPSNLEDDAGPERIPNEADILVGMATVEQYRSFRHTRDGSIYIQELCKQLEWAASRKEDILAALTRVNREVSKGEYEIHYVKHKQMPEPKYTLTKKLVLNFV